MDIKKQAKKLCKIMRETNPEYKLHEAYETLAHEAGFKDWNTYSAKLKSGREASQKFRQKQKLTREELEAAKQHEFAKRIQKETI